MSTRVQFDLCSISTMVATCWDRIKPDLDARKWGIQQLADAIGVSYNAVNKVKNGGGFGTDNNIKVAKLFKLNPEWLATGQGPRNAPPDGPSRDSSAEAPAPGTPVLQSSLRKIWVVGKGSGGAMPERIWGDGDYPAGATDSYGELGSSDPNAFLFEIVGSSMYPKFEDKNFALVEPNTAIDIEDCVLIRLASGETMIKRLLSQRHGYKLGSFNDPKIYEYEESEVTWLYYVAHEVPRKKIKGRY